MIRDESFLLIVNDIVSVCWQVTQY